MHHNGDPAHHNGDPAQPKKKKQLKKKKKKQWVHYLHPTNTTFPPDISYPPTPMKTPIPSLVTVRGARLCPEDGMEPSQGSAPVRETPPAGQVLTTTITTSSDKKGLAYYVL